MSSQILFYSGKGVGTFCSESLLTQLKNLSDDRLYTIRQVKAFDEGWSDPRSVSAYVIPGGNAGIMYIENMEKNLFLTEMFKKYNTSYYGACAAGILASKECHGTISDKSPNRIPCVTQCKPDALLGIFPGQTIAPLFSMPSSRKLSITDFRHLNIKPLNLSSQSLISSIHILSPGYLDVEQIPGAQVLAHFENIPIFKLPPTGEKNSELQSKTICESVFYQAHENSSRVLLTSSHLEMDSKAVLTENFRTAFNATTLNQEQFANALQVDDFAREALQKSYFEKIGISCKP